MTNNKAALTDRKRSLIFLNIVVSCIASSMLATALTTALPSIIADFSITVTMGQWLTSGYSLAMGIIMPLTAFLITRFPTKRLYLCGLALTIAGLVLCVVAPNFPFLMAARILQASGNGILSAMAQVIILSIYPPEKRGTAMGWYGLSIGAAPVIAPTLAGILVDSFGWRSIFYLAIAIMGVSLVCALAVFENVLDTVKKRFDTVSFVLSAFAFGGITLGVGSIGSAPFVSGSVLGVLAVGVVAGIVFVIRQLKASEPFLELRILKNKSYAVSVAGSMLLYLVVMGSTILMPLYVQTILGRSATLSGLVVLPGSLASVIVSPFAGKIYDRIGIKPLFVCGGAAMLLSNFSLFFIRISTGVWVSAVCNVVRNISIACLMMPLVTFGTDAIGAANTAHGTALLTSLRTIAGAIGTAVFVGIMNFVAQNSAAVHGAQALMHGFNVAFLWMGLASTLLLLLGMFGISGKGREPAACACRVPEVFPAAAPGNPDAPQK